MGRRTKAGSAKARRRKPATAKCPSRVEATRSVSSSAAKEELEFAPLRSRAVDIDEAKKAEERHRRSEFYLAEAQRISHTGSWAWDPVARRLRYCSDEWYRIWGFDPAQGPPDPQIATRRIHPDDQDRVYHEAMGAARQKRDYRFEFRIVLPDGAVKYLETIGHHLFSARGELVEVIGTNVDVTERKRAEERLRVQHTVALILAEGATIEEVTPRILRAIGECLGWDVGALWRVDREAEALRCVEFWHKESIEVPEFERLSREFTFVPGLGLPGRVWSSLEPAYINDVVPDENFQRAPIAEREGLHAAFGFPILLGGEVLGVIEFFSREIRQPDQELLNMLATIGSQISQFIERKRAEAELRESEAKFRDYAETASDWFWEIGQDYKFTLLSENAFGSGSADRIGTTCWDHALDLETESEKWRLVWATLDARKPFRDFVYRGMSSDGAPMYIKASGKPVFDDNAEFRGYRGTGTDVTAIMHAQQVEASLQEVQAELTRVGRVATLGQLTASIAHEVTQPIASARNNTRAALNFLDRQPSNLGEVKEALECATADADRAGQIVDRIRDHIKKAPSRKDRFNLNKAIDEVLLLARSAITDNEVSVQTRLTEGSLPVQGDRVQVQQVVLNLILNAVEAMSSVEVGSRELLISTEQDRKGVLVAVHDSGPGIDPEKLERVFEAFYTTKSNGVGMGLSICRSIVEGHGGRLWAGANKPRGTVFQFTLPYENS